MKDEAIIQARKKAESAVADMAAGPLKVAAFQTILGTLLQGQLGSGVVEQRTQAGRSRQRASGTAARVLALAEEGFFAEQRSLGEIQGALAERGFHYAQEDLGTPVTRLVQKRLLRRVRAAAGGKSRWKYSAY